MSQDKASYTTGYIHAFMTLLKQIAPDLLVGYTIIREYTFADPRKFRFDLAWIAQRVAVEVDGGQWVANGGRHNRDSDREKMNYAAANGWRVMHITPDMMRDDPASFFNLLRVALHVVNAPDLDEVQAPF